MRRDSISASPPCWPPSAVCRLPNRDSLTATTTPSISPWSTRRISPAATVGRPSASHACCWGCAWSLSRHRSTVSLSIVCSSAGTSAHCSMRRDGYWMASGEMGAGKPSPSPMWRRASMPPLPWGYGASMPSTAPIPPIRRSSSARTRSMSARATHAWAAVTSAPMASPIYWPG